MHIRPARAGDTAALARVFFEAVREGPSPYTQAQRAAWLPQAHDPVAFSARLAGLHVAVAEDAGLPVGFIAMTPEGYIDLVFIVAAARGRGAFRGLHDTVERAARAQGLNRLWTHASLMAQPAFRAMGFKVIRHELSERAGETLARAEMEKPLT